MAKVARKTVIGDREDGEAKASIPGGEKGQVVGVAEDHLAVETSDTSLLGEREGVADE